VSAAAEDPRSIGDVTAVTGEASQRQGDELQPLRAGDRIRLGAEIASGAESRAELRFDDGSVLVLEASTRIVIVQNEVDPKTRRPATLVRLLAGRVRGKPGPDYAASGGAFRVESPTATAHAEEGDFVVGFDDAGAVTDVLGFHGTVAVHSTLDPEGNGVLITARQATRVPRGEIPKPVYDIDPRLIRQYTDWRDPATESWSPAAARTLQPFLSGSFVDSRDSPATSVPGFADLPGLQRSRGNSLQDGNDAGSIVGRPMDGPGGLGFDVRF
jgi:hypothetical protein